MKECYKCHTTWDGETTPGFKSTCEKCLAYLHCCMNCKYIDMKTLLCSNSSAPKISDPEKFNTCDEFKFEQNRSNLLKEDSSALKKFNDLFSNNDEK